MKIRLHLFEFEDFSWYPNFLREGQTDYLRFLMKLFQEYKLAIPILGKDALQTQKSYLLDLCSGGGGTMLLLKSYWEKELGIPFKAKLTDLYPNLSAFQHISDITEGAITYETEPLNALDLPYDPEAFVSIFNGFHHFKPEEAGQFLKKITDKKMPIGIFEPLEKSWLQLILNTLAVCLFIFPATLFIRPFKWTKIIFTYLIPLIPICTLWDGWVSVFRLYDPQKLREMTQPYNDTYEWKIGMAKHTFGSIIYCIGLPKEA